MLWFVGLGITGSKSISCDVQNILAKADFVYLEQFTSPLSDTDVAAIKKMVKGEFKLAKRWMIEDGKEILDNAKKKKVVLLSYGDPYVATTHIELRTRATSEKIKTDTVHGASSITSLVGEAGLHYYKIGKVVTIMEDFKSMTSVYYTIYHNLLLGNHTVLLLEYNQDKNFFLKPNDALSYLLDVEKEQQRKVISPDTFAVITSRIGLKNQAVVTGKLSSLMKKDFGDPPHSIIITGKLHFTESDALKLLSNCIDSPYDNTDKIKKISTQMIEKYIPMIRTAIEEIAPHYKNSDFEKVIENAQLYVQDAKNFHEQGKDELAILSIGYADGLVDALRIAKGLEPKI